MHASTYPYIFDVFEKRFEIISNSSEPMITIISSNSSIEELEERYKKIIQNDLFIERLFSRIRGLINKQILFVGTDKRQGDK